MSKYTAIVQLTIGCKAEVEITKEGIRGKLIETPSLRPDIILAKAPGQEGIDEALHKTLTDLLVYVVAQRAAGDCALPDGVAANDLPTRDSLDLPDKLN